MCDNKCHVGEPLEIGSLCTGWHVLEGGGIRKNGAPLAARNL